MAASKYTEWITLDGQAQIKAWVKQGLSDGKIAEKIGISRFLFSKWRKLYPEIRNATMRYTDLATNQAVEQHELIKAKDERKLLCNIVNLKQKISEWEQERKRGKLPLTISSLCLFLGVTKKQFNKYANNDLIESHTNIIDPFTGDVIAESVSSVLQLAKLRIESDLEDRMIKGEGSTAGIMFDLKNHHGYVDRQTVENEIKTERKDGKTDDERIEELLSKRDGALKIVNG